MTHAALENPVWHSLSGVHSGMVAGTELVRGGAGRFPHDVARFGAVRDPLDESHWKDLGEVVGPGGFIAVFLPSLNLPSGWLSIRDIPCFQMVLPDSRPLDDSPPAGAEIADLTGDDVDEMIALVRATEPGPFEKRTIELGRYLGIRRDGDLIAMAGERLKIDGFTEISAVCTAADSRGQGLAALLTSAVAQHIRSRGATAMLHVAQTNTNAIRVYERLGFATERELTASIIRRDG